MKIAEFIVEQKVEEEWSAKYKRSIDCSNPKGFSQRAHCQGRKKNEDVELEEDEMSLRDWFGKGKHGGAGGGGWDRYNSKGERIGKCGDRKPGEAKPKCLSKAKAASLRASGGKEAIAAAVNKKRREDPNPERRGRADMVSNTTRKKNNESVQVQEKAKSRQQQKYFAMVHALQKGEEVPGASAKLKQTAASMSKGDVADFAKTKHSGLPNKVKKKS